jgi:Putative Flp pilus-assembly TadE/G-like
MRDISIFRVLNHLRDSRASVATWIAVMLPGVIMAAGLGIEVGSWGATRVSTQRIADSAATAGITYLNTIPNQNGTPSSSSLWLAARYATEVAIMNGVHGASSPPSPPQNNTCSVCTVTNNNVTATVDASATPIKLTVSVNTPVTAMLSYPMFSSTSSHTITASSGAEWLPAVGGGASGGGNSGNASSGQPCLVALSTSGYISGSGSTYLTMPTCTLRSNGTVSVHGGGSLSEAGIYAGGAIAIDSWIPSTGQNPNAGTITDPYLADTALQTALTNTAALTGVGNIACGSMQGVLGTAGQYTGNNNCNGTNALPNGGSCTGSGSVTCTLHPGNYGSFIVSSGGPYTFNFQPGLYQFNGPVTLTQNTTTNATSGVTIIVSGQFTGSNTFNFNLTAPTPSQASSTGGIAGIALAGSSASTTTLSGSVNFNVNGVVYFPNALFDASGSYSNPSVGQSSTTCLEIIASSIKMAGYSDLVSNCQSFGALSFYSVGSSGAKSQAQLVN